MNEIHVLLSIHNVNDLLRQESDTCITVMNMNQIHVLLSIHNTHVLLRHESDTCVPVYT